MMMENIKMALASVRAARFRSFLTMLGIIIGVVSVITTISLGEGIKQQIAGQANSVGNDLITIRPGKLVKRDAAGEITGLNLLSFLASSSLTDKDLQTIKSNPNVETVVPFSVINGAPSLDKTQFNDGFVMATGQDMPKVVSQKVEFGNFFSDQQTNRNVAVIGYNVAEKLFNENVPIGKTFQIRGQDFVVSGIFERTPTNPLSPEIDFNNGVFIPYENAKSIPGVDIKLYEVLARPKDKSSAQVDQTIATLSTSLKDNHGQQDDFTVLRQDEMISVADTLLKLISTTVAIMASVALFVGGIGIMNVMLVSVTERTREIGIRKTVGATNRQIQIQFLIEAVVISIWGAVIGIALSGVINILFRIFTNLQPVITWQAVVASGLAAIITGIVFGMIPAIKASRKDPIDSLRSY